MTKDKSKKNASEGTFSDFYKQQPKEFQQMLDSLNINSFNDILEVSMLMGVDPEKLQRYFEEHEEDEFPPMEDVMFDDDDPAGEPYRLMKKMMENDGEENDDDDESDDDDDPFALPKEVFLNDDEPVKEYHLRIKLCNSPIPVWREVLVPSNISLEFLSFVILDVMGWENVHLHQFIYKNDIYKNRSCIKEDNEMFGFWMSSRRKQATEDFAVSHLFNEKGKRIKFEYDFGDGWMHEIWQKGVREYSSNEQPRLKVVKGSGACPPEDCGGVWGYSELLYMLSLKRKSREDKERLEWYGMDKDFNPEEFDIEFAQECLDGLWEYANM